MNDKNRRLKVLVLGGNGFIGSHIVSKLNNQVDVVIGTRKTIKQDNQLTVRMQEMLNERDWLLKLQGYDVVINSVGILRERRKESYEQVHTLAVEALAKACKNLAISLIHISALGLSKQAKSRFIRSKFAGEQAIIESDASASIVRPSLLDGEGGYGAMWFRRVARWPVHFVMRSEGLIAPLQVSDLGQAIANLVLMPVKERPSVVELGGDVYTIPKYLLALREAKTPNRAWQISLPKPIVRITSHLFDFLAWTPLSFGHYELMQGYNVPSKNLLPILLGRAPTPIGVGVDCVEPAVGVCV